jgi:protein TonB
MGHVATADRVHPALERKVEFRFQSLVLSEPESLVKGRGATVGLSLALHSAILACLILVPLFYDDILPPPSESLRAFFVSPAEAAPPPPPPPPPAPGPRAVTRAPAVSRPVQASSFVAPIEIPPEIKPEEGLDLGVEGGVAGGVEGGVPGGVVGGVVGGLPDAPPPQKAVRVGGLLTAPKKVKHVDPVFPPLASQARLSGLVILEALVDVRGHVQEAKVLRGAPLFDDAAMAAVRQWRYQPLLLNGQPTAFILTVTLRFNLETKGSTVVQ